MTRRTLSLPRSERWPRLAVAAPGGVLDRGARAVQHVHATAARREGHHAVACQGHRWGQRSREVRVGDAPLKPASKYSIDSHECMSMGLHRYSAFGAGREQRGLEQSLNGVIEGALKRRGTARATGVKQSDAGQAGGLVSAAP